MCLGEFFWFEEFGGSIGLPDQKLAEVRAAQDYPVPGTVEPHTVDGLVRDGQAVHQAHLRQGEEQEGSGAEADHEDLGSLVVISTGHLGIPACLLLQVISQEVSR